MILKSHFTLLIVCLFATSQLPAKDIPKYAKVHVTLGIPKDKTPNDDYIIARHQYVLSYNKNLRVANWVSWELNEDWYGDAERYTGSFIRDLALPDSFYRVKHSDYTNQGYDRGHMCSSEERTMNNEYNRSTFILTNVMPQTSDQNKGVWYNMELWCKNMSEDSSAELFVIAGGIFKKKYRKIKNNVAVPDSCFKIVVVLNKGEDLSDITDNTRIEAVIIPNKLGVRKHKWQRYKRTVREIEQSTGYDFLSEVPNEVQDVIENRK